MRRDVLVSGRVKSMNETIYYSVDTIQEAISLNRQISFRYFDWGIDGKRKYREKAYVASPYGLCQDNENCYLLAHSERHGATSYRIDRMTDIQITDSLRNPCPELSGKALNQYANRLFQMYSGQETDVKLRFHRRFANAVIDKFGRDILLIPDGEDHFVFTVKVAVSPMFLSWVVGFGRDAQILHPQSVIDACRNMCLEALSQYQPTE
jgi:predicted DNA-binding transcriptional regulator YafY